ncbi:MAG: DUF3034 family protein [Armatimonadetes bacterium]|nr:DUF3034 family protein [Armatimonadota bacterium]
MIRTIVIAAIAASLLVAGSANAALQLEGQSGVFLNALAYPIGQSKYEVSSHYIDLEDLGGVSTYNIAAGLKNNLEVGFTRVASDVTGVSDQNIFLAKWQFHPETATAPALSLSAAYRDLIDGDNSLDFGLIATKVIKAKYPVILGLGVRSTKAQGLGLFGFADDREVLFEGAIGVFVTDKLIVATEFKQQIQSRVWSDIAVRYVASNDWNLDAGLANLGPGLSSQFAFALTKTW